MQHWKRASHRIVRRGCSTTLLLSHPSVREKPVARQRAGQSPDGPGPSSGQDGEIPQETGDAHAPCASFLVIPEIRCSYGQPTTPQGWLAKANARIR